MVEMVKMLLAEKTKKKKMDLVVKVEQQQKHTDT